MTKVPQIVGTPAISLIQATITMHKSKIRTMADTHYWTMIAKWRSELIEPIRMITKLTIGKGKDMKGHKLW